MDKPDIAIVVSKKDPAGMNIREQLLQFQQFPSVIGSKKVNLFVREEGITETEAAGKEISAGVFIFASRHVSKAGVHSLSVHSIGNWGKALGGGKDKTLVPAPAILMKGFFKLLVQKAEEAQLDYEIVQEATHHGPYLEKPAMFIEIGSDEERWKDKKAGKAIAATILDAIKNADSSMEGIKAAVGIGGMHYASNFRKAMLSETVALSYVCPKYMLEFLDEKMLRQATEKSIPKATTAILDWKGLGQEKGRIIKLLDKLGVKYGRSRDFA